LPAILVASGRAGEGPHDDQSTELMLRPLVYDRRGPLCRGFVKLIVHTVSQFCRCWCANAMRHAIQRGFHCGMAPRPS